MSQACNASNDKSVMKGFGGIASVRKQIPTYPVAYGVPYCNTNFATHVSMSCEVWQ